MSRRLGPNSIRDSNWQRDEYERMMGQEAAERQELAAKLERGECVCKKRTVKLRGVFRTLHSKECPKRKPYMDEVERDLEERKQASAVHSIE